MENVEQQSTAEEAVQYPECEHAEGIYFGMPEETYFAAKALSCSYIKKLIVSEKQFWHCMYNPKKKPDESKKTLDYGKAMHRYTLEPDTFLDAYAFVPKGSPKKPTSAQINAKKKSPKTVEAIRWWEAFAQDMGDRKIAKAAWLEEFAESHQMLQYYPEIKDAFKDGYPEVSIFLKVDGIMFKCRIDYLKADGIEDLKTFSNSREKPIDDTVKDAITYEKYNLQHYIYYLMLKALKKRLRAGTIKVFGDVKEQFLHDLADSEGAYFALVFRESAAPWETRRITLEQAFDEGATPNLYWTNAEQMFEKAIHKFKRCFKKYGIEPWIPATTNYTLSDEEIPQMMYQKY